MKTTIAKLQEGATDSRIFFRRPVDNSIYAVLSPKGVRDLKRRKQLDAFLTEQRDSGVVIEIAQA